MNDFGIAVSFLRSIRGWSREQLASASGLGVASIARLEQGGSPRRRSVEQILKAFGLSEQSWQRLLDLIGDVRREMLSGPAGAPRAADEPLEDLLSALAPRIFAAFAALPMASAKPKRSPLPSAADRSTARGGST